MTASVLDLLHRRLARARRAGLADTTPLPLTVGEADELLAELLGPPDDVGLALAFTLLSGPRPCSPPSSLPSTR